VFSLLKLPQKKSRQTLDKHSLLMLLMPGSIEKKKQNAPMNEYQLLASSATIIDKQNSYI
jgi:hypothetical protein